MAKPFAFQDSKHRGLPCKIKALGDQLIAFSHKAQLSKTEFRREPIGVTHFVQRNKATRLRDFFRGLQNICIC